MGAMDKLLKDAENSNEEDNVIETSTLEIAGIKIAQESEEVKDADGNVIGIKDRLGKFFAVPAYNVDDYDDLHADGSFHDGKKEDPRFIYIYHRNNDIPQLLSDGWGVVSKEELGLPAGVIKEYGQPVTTAQTVGGSMTCMKIPRIIYERIRTAKEKRNRERLKGLDPTPEMLKQASKHGLHMMVESNRGMGTIGPEGERIDLEPVRDSVVENQPGDKNG